jgi:hypothetical protein
MIQTNALVTNEVAHCRCGPTFHTAWTHSGYQHRQAFFAAALTVGQAAAEEARDRQPNRCIAAMQ